MDSTDFGLMNMATGCRDATWSLLIAFPLTSNIQCFPCEKDKITLESLGNKFWESKYFS